MVDFSSKTTEQFKKRYAKVQKATLTGTGTTYYAVDVGYYCTVTINKNGSTAILKATNDFVEGGTVDAAEFGADLSTGTDDFHKGFTPGLTGFSVNVTAYVADVELVITHYLLGN